MTRALVNLPESAPRGTVIEVRAMLQHPMETGHRRDAGGSLVPRDIVTRFECRLDGALVFAADLYPAVAANPFIAFPLRAEQGGTLVLTWTGDGGFRHEEQRTLVVA
jgi:sulfur-oxidizing protein SoxZ